MISRIGICAAVIPLLMCVTGNAFGDKNPKKAVFTQSVTFSPSSGPYPPAVLPAPYGQVFENMVFELNGNDVAVTYDCQIDVKPGLSVMWIFETSSTDGSIQTIRTDPEVLPTGFHAGVKSEKTLTAINSLNGKWITRRAVVRVLPAKTDDIDRLSAID